MAAGGLESFEDVLLRYELEKKDLERKCSVSIRLEIAEELGDDWKMVGHYLGFTVRDLNDICTDNNKEEHRRVAMLDIWSQRQGSGATCLKLTEAVYRKKRIDLAEKICQRVRVSLGGANRPLYRGSETLVASQRGNKILTMDNFAVILNAIWPARSMYYNLGLALHMSPNDLDAIQKTNFYRVDECFTDMLKCLLRNNKELSQDVLADALGSVTVGFGSLAHDFRSMIL